MARVKAEIGVDDDAHVIDRIDPWVNVQPNCKTQTGGDWYRLFVSASLNKKILHGINTAPSMEVLGKVPYVPDENMAVGFLRWDERTVKPDMLGSRVSDKFYSGHHYRGGHTKSGAFVAFDEGAWEPSLKARARASAILAAGIASHGCTKAEALETTRRITSDEVDAEAVDSTLLPTSHLKREMTTVSKAHHMVFGQGTIQQGITWDDQRISLSQYVPHVAYDWGRITAIARYIAEANIQICPAFRREAGGVGIPYHIARNAWAEVSAEDFNLPPDLFKDVPKLDLAAVGVPSIKGAFIDHDQEAFAAFTRFLNTEPIHPTTEAYRGLVSMTKALLKKREKKTKVRVANVGEMDEEAMEVHSHELTDKEVLQMLQPAVSPLDLLAQAVSTRTASDYAFKSATTKYFTSASTPTQEFEDNVVRLVFGTATWVLAGGAAKIMAKNINDPSLHGRGHDLLIIQLARLKSELFGVFSHIDTHVTFDEGAMLRLRPALKDILARSRKEVPITHAVPHDFLTPATLEAEAFVTSLGPQTMEHLAEIRETVAKDYKKAAQVASKTDTVESRQLTANYLVTAVSLKTLGIRTIQMKHTGFIDCSVPKETYIYKAGKKLQDKYGFGKVKLKHPNHMNANQVAEDLDQTSVLSYSMKQAVTYAVRILEKAVGLLAIGTVLKTPVGLMEEALEHFEAGDSPRYDTQELDEEADLAAIEAMLAEADEIVQNSKVDNYAACLATYPNKEMAEQYAQLNGYKTFKEAFDKLDFKAANDDDNPFVLIAVTRLPEMQAVNPVPKKAKTKDYAPML